MLIGSTHEKYAAAVLTYGIDWSRYLGTALIDDSDWVITGPDDALTASSPNIETGGKVTTIVLSAGTPGATYKVTNTVAIEGVPMNTDPRHFYVTVKP